MGNGSSIGQKMMSQTYSMANNELSYNNVPIQESSNVDSDALVTERRDVGTFNDNVSSTQAYNNA